VSGLSERRFEYRVVWKRRDLGRKVKRYARRDGAERFASILRATTAEEVLRLRGKDPHEEVCCNGYMCGCGGETYLGSELAYREKMPPLQYCVVEEREVGTWALAIPRCGKCGDLP